MKQGAPIPFRYKMRFELSQFKFWPGGTFNFQEDFSIYSSIRTIKKTILTQDENLFFLWFHDVTAQKDIELIPYTPHHLWVEHLLYEATQSLQLPPLEGYAMLDEAIREPAPGKYKRLFEPRHYESPSSIVFKPFDDGRPCLLLHIIDEAKTTIVNSLLRRNSKIYARRILNSVLKIIKRRLAAIRKILYSINSPDLRLLIRAIIPFIRITQDDGKEDSEKQPLILKNVFHHLSTHSSWITNNLKYYYFSKMPSVN